MVETMNTPDTTRAAHECREAFETWYADTYCKGNLSDEDLERIGDSYATPGVGCAWEGWQAAWQAQQRRYDDAVKVIQEMASTLENAEYCINAHSERLAVALEEEGNSEPQFACEATYTCGRISDVLTLAAPYGETGK